MKVAVIGGGAAGFYAAIHIKENYPNAQVIIFEKSKKVLAKVKISGGGRCNVTNGAETIGELSKAYPRGEKQLRKLFGHFNNHDVMQWFEERGVPLAIQEDNCVFPISQNSQSIIDCFLNEANRLGVEVLTSKPVKVLKPLEDNTWQLGVAENTRIFDKVVVATGGSPKLSGLKWLADIGHSIVTPVPSLFTFNMPNESIKELMGIVVEQTLTTVQGTKLKGDGPLLITHWGMSGPAILKLSAFGARTLSELNYDFNVQVSWLNTKEVNVVENKVKAMEQEGGQKWLTSIRPPEIPDRLWRFLLIKCGLPLDKKWNELGKKGRNKLVNILTNDSYAVKGKTTFKEEFVTCGGVGLKGVNFKTMESKVHPNLFFAGEVLDVDGITGGYNFQAAWTTAYIAAKLGER